MTNLNENIVPVMIAFIFAIIIFAKLADYYGKHQYHYYIEYNQKSISAGIYEIDFESRWASGFIDLKHADFSKGQSHIMDLLHQIILANCGNCVIETDSLQIKSLARLD